MRSMRDDAWDQLTEVQRKQWNAMKVKNFANCVALAKDKTALEPYLEEIHKALAATGLIEIRRTTLNRCIILFYFRAEV